MWGGGIRGTSLGSWEWIRSCTQTPVWAFICVHVLPRVAKWGCKYIHRKKICTPAERHAHTHARSQKLSHIISQNKLVWPLDPIFLDKGRWEAAGSPFDVADSPRVSNEEVDYTLIGAPYVFVGQAVDMARLSHTSRWAQWTPSSAVWIQMIYVQLAIRLQPGVEYDCLEESTSLLAFPN